MNTSEMSHERISALIDGEWSDSQISVTCAALDGLEGQAAWDVYHRIGDVLRSDDMDITLSPNFAASLLSRLDAEPAIVAPVRTQVQTQQQEALATATGTGSFYKRLSIPGMAVAATVAVFAFISAPQLMVAVKGAPQQRAVSSAMVASASAVAASTTLHSSQEGTVLRDPEIDQYLLAHQRFSPSTYSIAQYARPATFATDSDK